jgi:hypothetical protein
MKFPGAIITVLSVTVSSAALAQLPQASTMQKGEAPPPLGQVLSAAKTEPEFLSSLLSAKPQIPLGPDYVLQGYENDMALVRQKLSLELQSIERAPYIPVKFRLMRLNILFSSAVKLP